jgi:hypothetical protein
MLLDYVLSDTFNYFNSKKYKIKEKRQNYAINYKYDIKTDIKL